MTNPPNTRIRNVTAANRDGFLDYARTFGPQHDESYVTAPEDLAAFDPKGEPAVVALGKDNAVLGAASVMVQGYSEEGSARFRILHAAKPALYAPMLERVLKRLPAGVRSVFLFLPEDAGPIEAELTSWGFRETRRAYMLTHAHPGDVREARPPEGTLLMPATGADAATWARVVNEAFGGDPGRYDMTADGARNLLTRPRIVRDGTLTAWRVGQPIGVVLTIGDPDDPSSAEIETLAVAPGHQGGGVGKALLHSAVRAAASEGFASVALSTAATNERALKLYRDTGFGMDDARVCWQVERASA